MRGGPSSSSRHNEMTACNRDAKFNKYTFTLLSVCFEIETSYETNEYHIEHSRF
ncbi:MAG: hypothetical protein ACTS6G_00525 [Candidatus Hodgkinia cicadicola]